MKNLFLRETVGVEQKIIPRYSMAFKEKLVAEIDAGALTICQAQKFFDIRGVQTIQYLLRRLSKMHLLNHVVRIETADETSKRKQLEKETYNTFWRHLSLDFATPAMRYAA